MPERTIRDVLNGYVGIEARLRALNGELAALLAGTPPVVEPPDPEPAGVLPKAWAVALTRRGVTCAHDGAHRYDLSATYYEGDAAQGRHHILVDVLDDQGHRKVGATVRVAWPGGDWQGVAEAKPGEPWALAFPMYASGFAYSLSFGGWTVSGMGLGTIAEPHMGHHVSYGFVFRERGAG